MKTIELTQGKIALVDDEDYKYLMLFKWYAKESGPDRWYAVRKSNVNNYVLRKSHCKKDRRTTVRMHNAIMQPEKGNLAHHVDGDGLNNQRSNLEVCSTLENQRKAAAKTNQQKYIPF